MVNLSNPLPSKETVRARCTTVKAWQLPKQDRYVRLRRRYRGSMLTIIASCLAPPGVWTNADMDPVPPKYQTWTLWTWMAYWATDTINLGTWETASSVIAVGLNWRDAIPVVCFPIQVFARPA